MKKFIAKTFSRKYFIKITLPIILLLALIIIGIFSFQKPEKVLSQEQAKTVAVNFINKYLMQGGNKATVKEISSEYGLYKLKINIVTSDVDSYLSKDGKLFFPQALDINEITNKASAEKTTPTTPPVAVVNNKNDKPNVDLFVMSYCPFGTQIEKGILPVLSTLKNKINFKLRFVDYSMHGLKELTENLNQYCIQKNEPQKLDKYLSCFLEAGDSASCLNSSNINKTQLKSCISSTDKKYKITANFNNKVNYRGSYPSFPIDKADNKKYNVLGSPALIINDQEIKSGRDASSLLKTICSAFTNQPQECQTVLSSTSPAPGLGSINSGDDNTDGAVCE